MTQKSKTAAEYYALGAIELQQLLEESSTEDDFREVMKYALQYEEGYNQWLVSRRQREAEMLHDWEAYEEPYYLDAVDILDMLEAMEVDDMHDAWELFDMELKCSKYSDTDLEAAYRAYESTRKAQIKRIGKEAYLKGIPFDTINRFIKEYNLSNAEVTIFWVEYFKYSYLFK